MPGRDRKGPMGQGPMSGRGAGLCSGQGQGQMFGGGRQRRGNGKSRDVNRGCGLGGRGARWVHSWFGIDGLGNTAAAELSSNQQVMDQLNTMQSELQSLKQKVGLDLPDEDEKIQAE